MSNVWQSSTIVTSAINQCDITATSLKGNLFCARCGRRLGITAPTNRHGTTYAYFYCLGRQNDKTSCKQIYVARGVM
ncbi:MAG: zinc ribbon domain-containing protein [Pseudonocardiaceae bacterium]